LKKSKAPSFEGALQTQNKPSFDFQAINSLRA